MSSADLPFSPAADRNRGPLLAALRELLPADAEVVEIASGTGQHAQAFAGAQPGWRWQPTEADERLLPVIAQRCSGLPNVAAPRRLDVMDRPALPAADAVVAINLIHIAPWPACQALMRLAADCLRAGGRLVLYGPFVVDGEPTAPSNLAFDADLRARNPAWGVRRLEDVVQAAGAEGLHLERRIAMPANNLTVVFASQVRGTTAHCGASR